MNTQFGRPEKVKQEERNRRAKILKKHQRMNGWTDMRDSRNSDVDLMVSAKCLDISANMKHRKRGKNCQIIIKTQQRKMKKIIPL